MILCMANWEGQLYKTKCSTPLWYIGLESQDTKFIKLAYQVMLNDIELSHNCVNWASNVKVLLSSLGFHEVWVNQGVGNKNVFLRVFKQRLTDCFIQN